MFIKKLLSNLTSDLRSFTNNFRYYEKRKKTKKLN